MDLNALNLRIVPANQSTFLSQQLGVKVKQFYKECLFKLRQISSASLATKFIMYDCINHNKCSAQQNGAKSLQQAVELMGRTGNLMDDNWQTLLSA